jgi:hypothetical protein
VWWGVHLQAQQSQDAAAAREAAVRKQVAEAVRVLEGMSRDAETKVGLAVARQAVRLQEVAAKVGLIPQWWGLTQYQCRCTPAASGQVCAKHMCQWHHDMPLHY